MSCKLHLNRLDVCNGQLSWEALCADRNCLFALENAEANQGGCTGVAGFENVPSLDMLCGEPDGERLHASPSRCCLKLRPCCAQ